MTGGAIIVGAGRGGCRTGAGMAGIDVTACGRTAAGA